MLCDQRKETKLMDYSTKLTCTVSAFSETAKVADFEQALALSPTKSNEVGQPRKGDSGAVFDRTSVYYEVVRGQVANPVKAIDSCLSVVQKIRDHSVVRSSRVWITVGLEDGEFVQVVLPPDLLEQVTKVGVGIAIENRSLGD